MPLDRLIHKNCGGVVTEDWSKVYEYDSNQDDEDAQDYNPIKIPAYRCKKCGNEIGGDAELEDLTD